MVNRNTVAPSETSVFLSVEMIVSFHSDLVSPFVDVPSSACHKIIKQTSSEADGLICCLVILPLHKYK